MVRHDTGEVTRTPIRRQTPCGKQGYSSKKIAKYHANVQRKATGEDIEAYRCWKPGCHCWHLGHRPGSPRQVRDGSSHEVEAISEHA